MNLKTVRFGCIAAALAALLLLSSCEEGTPSTDDAAPADFSAVDMQTAVLPADGLAEYLLANVTFDDPNLIKMDAEIAESLYNVGGLAESVASYGSGGATAEAILVLKCADAEKAAAAAGKIDKYRVEMAEIYASYNQPESVKLTKALLAQDGVYVVFCVSPDASAAENAYHAYVLDTVFAEK